MEEPRPTERALSSGSRGESPVLYPPTWVLRLVKKQIRILKKKKREKAWRERQKTQISPGSEEGTAPFI
jgi:hypothetical protein